MSSKFSEKVVFIMASNNLGNRQNLENSGKLRMTQENSGKMRIYAVIYFSYEISVWIAQKIFFDELSLSHALEFYNFTLENTGKS